MEKNITGIEAVTKDSPRRVNTREGTERAGVGLEVGLKTDSYWLWMGDGKRTLGVQMTHEEVGYFTLALSAFTNSDYPEAAWGVVVPTKPRQSLSSWFKAIFQ
jgi:hypothetical protein